MTTERWQQIEDLFHQGLQVPLDNRERWLLAVCPEDATLRHEVMEMLAADGRDADRFETPVAGAAYEMLDTPRPVIPVQIGPYRIIRELGSGGMGTVLLAERADEHYRKQVAIKLIRAGVESAFARERFVRERQILAGLDHPYIARLLDGGTDSGRPYLVLDFVEGA